MAADDRRPLPDAIGEQWDALVRGTPTPPPPDLDPSFIDTIRRVSALDDARAPDPAFVRRLERELMAMPNATTRTGPFALNLRAAASPNGHAGLPPRFPRAPVPERPSRQWLAALAMAALLLATLVSGYVAFQPYRFDDHDRRPADIPALIGTPEAGLPPGVTENTVLFHQRFDVIPYGADWTGIERYTFAPGETWPQGKTPGAGYGPMLYRLESGAMRVRAPEAFTLTRAGAAASTQAPKDTDIVLAPGDVVFMPFGVVSEWRNSGATPARLMDAGVAFTSDTSPKDVDADFNYNAYPIQPPSVPVDFTLRRLTLAPGGSIPTPSTPGVDLLGVEAGRLTLVETDQTKPASPPSERQVDVPAMNGLPNMIDLASATPVVQAVRNDSAEPATMLLLMIAPVEATKTLPADQTAGSPGGAANGVLLQARIERPLPAFPWVEVERMMLSPGAEERFGDSASHGEGAIAFRVESGAVTFLPNGPALITRGVGQPGAASMPVAAGSAVVLSPGDQAFTERGVTARRRNEGTVPATTLELSLTTNGAIEFGHDGVAFTDPVWENYSGTPRTPATATLRRLTLAPGATMSARELPGLEEIYLEAGALDAAHGESAASDMLAPAVTPWATHLDAGQTLTQLGSYNAIGQLRNPGDQPAVFLAVMVVPTAGTGTPAP